MAKSKSTESAGGTRKILALKASLKLKTADLKTLLGVKKVKRCKNSDDFIYWLESSIRHKSIVDDQTGENYRFYEVGSDAASVKLVARQADFGYALTFEEDLIDDFIDAAVIFDEIMQIRVDLHNCVTKHDDFVNTLQGWGRETKALLKYGPAVTKISHAYGQKMMEQSYDFLNDALTSTW